MSILIDWLGDWIWIAPLILVGFVLLPYLLGPVLIYFTMKISGRPRLKELFLKDPSIPRTVKKYVSETLAPLEEDEGFAVLGAYFLASVTNVRSFVVLICKEETRDMALLAVTYADAGIVG